MYIKGRTWGIFRGNIWVKGTMTFGLLALFDLSVGFLDLSLVYQALLDFLRCNVD